MAVALGLAAFASTTTPAAALSFSQINAPKIAESYQHSPAANGNASTPNRFLNRGGNEPWKAIGPIANSQNQPLPVNPPLHVCPLDKPSCPPLPTPNGNGRDNGRGNDVSINLPPVVIGRPAPVFVAPQPVIIERPQLPVEARPALVQGQPVAPTATAAMEPGSCLTKQYLSDGSALFRDACTGESAIATAAQLQAEAQARAAQAPAAQPQASTN